MLWAQIVALVLIGLQTLAGICSNKKTGAERFGWVLGCTITFAIYWAAGTFDKLW